jgi:hypothetical protein
MFHVKIRAYGHMANFNIEAEDSAESIELAILDKIGKKGYITKRQHAIFC